MLNPLFFFLMTHNGQASAAFQSGDFQKWVWPKAKKFVKIAVFGMSADA